MKHASAVAAETKASWVIFAMLDIYCLNRATTCRCCTWI